MKKFFTLLKRAMIYVLVIAFIWAVFNISLIAYGFGQLKGQLHIVMNAQPMEEVLNDQTFPDSLKQKIHLIEQIKQFAIDTLGLKPSKNYTTLYDQHNKPLLWVLTASEPFKLKAYHWNFPFLGSVSYKGYFDQEKGKAENQRMKFRGYDTDFGEVSAWSTLGWFKDPILSNMLRRNKGQLAELIIHEMTHATLYVKSDVDFNENLASVCGEQGAIRFLQSTYGNESPELIEYLNRKEDYDRFSNQMLMGSKMLDSLYTLMDDSLAIQKMSAKDKLIKTIVNSLDTITFHNKKRFKDIFKDEPPNNAYFLGFVRYDAQKIEMKNQLNSKFNGNINAYIDYLRDRN